MKLNPNLKYAVCISVLGLFACSDNSDIPSVNENSRASPNLPETPFNYAKIELPDHYKNNDFPARFIMQKAAIDMDTIPDHNLTTDAGATLGRVLFYDKKLSANGTISCSSCHLSESGFSDPEAKSTGFDGEKTSRYSVGITNVRFYATNKFFRDERATSLEEQALVPFEDSIEMGLVLPELEEIVRNQAYYPSLFEAAFGDPDVSSGRIGQALAQFMQSMTSTTAKYDTARADVASPLDDFPQFTTQENLGKSLFFNDRVAENGDVASCATCHVTEAFVAAQSPFAPQGSSIATSIGLVTTDLGVGGITENKFEMGLFKVQSLRNVAARSHYMHDGRFSSLEEVLDHYSSGVTKTDNLSIPLSGTNGEPFKFNFTTEEKAAIIAFLETLTDEKMLKDEKFSDPFLD